jgi:DNA-binding response OmpR family regulator
MTLSFKGFKVLEATEGAEGLALARSALRDLILLDVLMPGIDGLTLGKTLAADPVRCRIPVVMLSALGQRTDIAAGLATGVSDYLVKPSSPWELLDRVSELIAATQQAG